MFEYRMRTKASHHRFSGVAGHEGSSGEIKVSIMDSNQKHVMLDLVKLSLNHMELPLCSGIFFQAL